MMERVYKEPNGNHIVLPPFIKLKWTKKKNCAIPACASYLLDRSKKCSTGVNKINTLPEKEIALERYKYEVGDFFLTDQYICKIPSKFTTGYGRESLIYKRFQI